MPSRFATITVAGMIDLKNVTKKFAEKTAVDDLNLSFGDREVIGLLGPNGAGKTTTMRLIIGYLNPSSGRITVGGLDVQKERTAVKKMVGYLPENNPLYPEMKTREYLKFVAEIKEFGDGEDLEKVISQCGLEEVLKQTIGELSRGYKQRVGLAAALIGNPKILILDEPTSGLDPNQIIEIRSLIKNLGQEKTIILSTHILPEVAQTCTRVVIIHKGRIAADKGVVDFGGEEEFARLTKEAQA